MIQLTHQMRILVAIEPADFRRGIDGLARLCREKTERLKKDMGIRRSLLEEITS